MAGIFFILHRNQLKGADSLQEKTSKLHVELQIPGGQIFTIHDVTNDDHEISTPGL